MKILDQNNRIWNTALQRVENKQIEQNDFMKYPVKAEKY